MPFLTQGPGGEQVPYGVNKTNWKYILIVVILAFLVGGGILFWIKTQEIPPVGLSEIERPEEIVIDETADLVPSEVEGWKTYRNEEYGFEIKYPGDIFTEKAVAEKTLPPSYTEEFSGLKLIHSIPIQHCGLSGLPEDCEPETQDITIGFFPIGKNFQDITTPIRNTLGNGYLKEIIVSGKIGTTFELGAEGEGVFYYLISLNQYKTLLITRSYINEKTVTIYQDAKDFIPIAEQEKLFNQMLSTFRFIEIDETADWKTYRFSVQKLKEIEGLTPEKQREVEKKNSRTKTGEL